MNSRTRIHWFLDRLILLSTSFCVLLRYILLTQDLLNLYGTLFVLPLVYGPETPGRYVR